jgi:hypothetical protein
MIPKEPDTGYRCYRHGNDYIKARSIVCINKTAQKVVELMAMVMLL